LVPFTRAVVPVVDLGGGGVVIDPPPGLLDEPAQLRGRDNPHPDPPPQAGEGMAGGKRRRVASMRAIKAML
jgi:hypothetical protein